MPRNTREWAHRKLDEAKNTLDWTATHLSNVISVYEQQHPEISEALEVVVELLAETYKSIDGIKRSF